MEGVQSYDTSSVLVLSVEAQEDEMEGRKEERKAVGQQEDFEKVQVMACF
jgi:hypothetical protein